MRRSWLIAAFVLTVPAPLAAAGLTVTKTTSVASDGISILPKALPGALVDEAVLVVSPLGNGLAAIAGVAVTDTIPITVKLCLADLGGAGSGPVEFADGNLLGLGLLGSGLSYRYASLASTTDAVDFSADGVTWSYVPVADAAGCDVNVRAIRVRLTGTQTAGSGFRLRYRVAIR